MIILQNAKTHTLPAGDILSRFNVICMVGNFAEKNNSGVFHYSVVGDAVAFDMVAVLFQLLNGFFFQTTANVMPEMNGSLEFFDIILPEPCGKGGKQKARIGFLGVAFGKRNILVAKNFGFAVDGAEVGAVHPAYQPDPYFRINDPVKIQAVLCIIVKGGCYPHLFCF